MAGQDPDAAVGVAAVAQVTVGTVYSLTTRRFSRILGVSQELLNPDLGHEKRRRPSRRYLLPLPGIQVGGQGAGKANEQVEQDENDRLRAFIAAPLMKHENPEHHRRDEQVRGETSCRRISK